jgi:hypothetical protein
LLTRIAAKKRLIVRADEKLTAFLEHSRHAEMIDSIVKYPNQPCIMAARVNGLLHTT